MKRPGTSPKVARRLARASSRRTARSAVAVSLIALRDLRWSLADYLGGPHHEEVVKAYHKEFRGLNNTVLEELGPEHKDYQTAVKRGTNCRVILEYKRSQCFKVRMVIQGFREMCSLLDGADFCHASDAAGMSAVRSLVFDPIARGSDMTISSCDMAQAFLQSDKFPESDPARFLKVLERSHYKTVPLLPSMGRTLWLQKYFGSLAAHAASVVGIDWFSARTQ